MKKYRRRYKVIENAKANAMDFAITYNKGGYNFATYKYEPRGYYFSFRPVTVEDKWVSFVAFSGAKCLIMECNRNTPKQFAHAKKMLDEMIKKHEVWWSNEYVVVYTSYEEEEE